MPEVINSFLTFSTCFSKSLKFVSLNFAPSATPTIILVDASIRSPVTFSALLNPSKSFACLLASTALKTSSTPLAPSVNCAPIKSRLKLKSVKALMLKAIPLTIGLTTFSMNEFASTDLIVSATSLKDLPRFSFVPTASSILSLVFSIVANTLSSESAVSFCTSPSSLVFAIKAVVAAARIASALPISLNLSAVVPIESA